MAEQREMQDDQMGRVGPTEVTMNKLGNYGAICRKLRKAGVFTIQFPPSKHCRKCLFLSYHGVSKGAGTHIEKSGYV